MKKENLETNTTAIETYLPLFSGFYGTWFESEFDNGIEYEIDYLFDSYNSLETLTQQEKEYIEKIGIDEFSNRFYGTNIYTTTYDNWKLAICQTACSVIENYFAENGFVMTINFQKIVHPMYYNFQNDSIDVEIVIDEENFNKILNHLKTNIDKFRQYLTKNYTSRDGFISYFSVDVNDWITNIEQGYANNQIKHEFGSVLNFLLHTFDTEDCYCVNERNDVFTRFYIDVTEDVGVCLNYSKIIKELIKIEKQ